MTPLDMIPALGAWGQRHTTEVLVGLLSAPLLAGAASLCLRRRSRHSAVMGSARWGTLREARQAGLVRADGIVLGRLRGRLLCDASERHILLVGATRSGKGTAVIIPSLLTWPGSVLVLDPKDGENHKVTAGWRARQGHTIAVFRPYAGGGVSLNVCDTIRFQTPHEFSDAYAIAQSHTAPAKLAHESATSQHFRELATMLLTAAQLHVGYTSQACSMGRVWHFLTQANQSLPACLKAMASSRHTSQGVHQAIAGMTTAIANISGDRELSSIWSTAIRPLLLYADPYVARQTETSTLALEALQYGPQPVALYLCAPSPSTLTRLHPLYRAITDSAMLRLMERPSYGWQHRLLLVADEAPLYGYTRLLDQEIAFMGSYGMKALIVAQDTVMLEDVFGKNTALWGNTHLKIFQTQANDLTAKRISENLLGRGTEAHPVESRQTGVFGRGSVSHQHVARPLLTTDEVMEVSAQQAIVRVIGHKPFLVTKVDYRHEARYQRRVYL